MNRRDAFVNSGAMLLAAASSAAMAEDMPHDHSHMHAASHDLLEATSDCVVKGQTCIAHCLMLLADGDKAMAACAKSVNQTIALCNALLSLAAQQSSLVPALARVTMDACQQCEKECRKHEKHVPCKDCAEACAACTRECKAMI